MDFPAIHKRAMPHSRAKLIPEIFGLEAAFAGRREIGETTDHRRASLIRIEQERAGFVDTAQNASSAFQRRAAQDHVDAINPRWEGAKQTLATAIAAGERADQQISSFAYLAAVEAWLSEDRTPRTRATPPKVGKVASFSDEVAKTRAQVAAKSDEIETVSHAPLPADALLTAALADLDARAAKGQPDYDARRRDGSPVKLGGALDTHSIGNTFAWLHRDALAERIKAMIGNRDAPGALSDDQREKRLAQLEAELLQLERYEEALICAAEAVGQRIPRRRDASPLAILEVE